ncbi:Imm64 family immunity protein [Sutcliffiella horikoshii]|uniref:Imm64 family immunity protein n=1 Tax=Sutcliffiella horikoshii TaxID=79883 RepID=UPI00384AD758
MKIFKDIDINQPSTPYFQVGVTQRIRFAMATLQEKPGLLKKIFENMKFDREAKVDCTFLSAYETDGYKRSLKLGLGRRFNITNWRENSIWNDDLECTCLYTTITNVSTDSLYSYILAFSRGYQRELYSCFYNKEYLIYVNGDVLDIVSSENNIAGLKNTFNKKYDRYHEEKDIEGGGGYINIATVYSEDKDMKENLLAFLDFFYTKENKGLRVTYSTDMDGEEWVEESVLDNRGVLDLLSNYYLTIEMPGKDLGIEGEELTITITEEIDFYGFLVNMRWEDVCQSDVNEVQETFIEILKHFYSVSNYDYALIGHELDIEIAPKRFKTIVEEADYFPVAIVGEDSKLHIYKGSCKMDGISEQDRSYEVVNVK